ncbi:efflux RND transporter periplasmic adaptor subunit [Thalassotalea aquiviva]|uniref:efflux RND transporter periplasmic adaptor subunit n=1 Tax=Thalassotalea aquiviva TaxID=3242415 RepID=UPI00352AA06C
MNAFLPSLLLMLLLPVVSVAQERSRPPANVILEQVDFAPINISIEAVGTAEAFRSVSLYPAASDKVTKVNFRPGDFVIKGETLIELDARRQVAAVQRAKIELADRKRDLARLIKSGKKGAFSQSELDDANSLVELASVTLSEAQADLDDRKVVAPFSGYVGLTAIEAGDRINTNTLITTIDDRKKLYINFALPESALGLVDDKTQVSVQPWNDRDKVFQAKLSQLDSRIDSDDRTLKVRAVLDNRADSFRPGLSFKVKMSAQGPEFPIVPEASLAWGATGAYVWMANEGKAQKIAVEIKQRLRGFILVEGELERGDNLIVEGIQGLREGAPIEPSSMVAEGR